ncbi:MAG: hypothetical protein OHK0039_01210 [Bacteroidia bacterium]
MVKNAFPGFFLSDLNLTAERGDAPLSSYLRDLSKSQEITDQDRLEEVFLNDLENASLETEGSVKFLLFTAKRAFWFWFLRHDIEQLKRGIDIFRHRMIALRSVPGTSFPSESWDQYLRLLVMSTDRVLQNAPLESFEKFISDIDWNLFGVEFISDVSSLIGYVYMHEPHVEHQNKGRIWLQKAINERPFESNYANYRFLSYFYNLRSGEFQNQQRDLIQQIRTKTEAVASPEVKRLYQAALFELEAGMLIHRFDNFDDNLTRLEHCQLQLKELETKYAQQQEHLPRASRAYIESLIATLYGQLHDMTDDDLEQASFSKHAIQHIDAAFAHIESLNDAPTAMAYKLQRAELATRTGFGITEKELKELVQYYKKRSDYPMYAQSVRVYNQLLIRNEIPQKTYDQLLDLFKYASKKLEQGGFYLIVEGMKMANDIFLGETDRPGISWMIEILDVFFEKVVQIIETTEENLAHIGKAHLEAFREEYLRFEPASHFNIKTYYRYQLYEIKILRLGAIINDDKLSVRIANTLLGEMLDDNNALSFIKADWDEFRKVPNSVRNKTLNKCINISKGDLPLAAQHLDFSYRNLRSYITFKEVNRLGFFLDIKQTNNRQLEQGIRYMFYDLYKRGTIFEVVFDMPKFLVNYSKSGFFSQDMERDLEIKGTTAKKYIKIMIEIGLIRQDKTTGRKHYYRLIRENVMNRLGKDQTTLINS